MRLSSIPPALCSEAAPIGGASNVGAGMFRRQNLRNESFASQRVTYPLALLERCGT